MFRFARNTVTDLRPERYLVDLIPFLGKSGASSDSPFFRAACTEAKASACRCRNNLFPAGHYELTAL